MNKSPFQPSGGTETPSNRLRHHFFTNKILKFLEQKVAYISFSHKNPIFDVILHIFMSQKSFSAEGVKMAIFRFWPIFTNKMSLKVGLKFNFYPKTLPRTLKQQCYSIKREQFPIDKFFQKIQKSRKRALSSSRGPCT